MHTITLLSLQFALALLARSAPLPECSGKSCSLMESQEFHKTVKESSSLVCKIMREIHGVHKSCVPKAFDLDSSTLNQELQYMKTDLGIPPSPTLSTLPADFTVELCLDRIYEGLQLHQDLLRAIRDRISDPKNMDEMLVDVKNLLAQVVKMRELAQLGPVEQYGGSGLSARLTKEFQVQAAAHITLHQLRSFSEHVFRSLRYIGRPKQTAKCPL